MHRRKRIARALAAAGLVIAMTAGTAFASYGTGSVSADALRMRSNPSTGSSIIMTLSKGTQVELLSAEESGWFKVSYKGTEGYMSADWINVLSIETSAAEVPSAPSDSTTDPAEPKEEETPVTTAVVKDGPLNVRSGPGTTYGRVGSLNKGTQVTVLEALDGWYQISSGSLTGYVSAQYLTIGSTGSADPSASTGDQSPSMSEEGLVLSGPLNVRSGPGTGYSRIGSLRAGSTVSVIGSSGDWYHITYGSLTGYVHSDYMVLMADIGSSPVGAAAAAMAMSLVGSPYVYGAAGPNAFDCSGLSYYIYKQLGYSIARGSSGQYNNSGSFVPLAEMEPGDLIYFFDPRFDGSGGTLPTTHMGIYVGNGQFIHASTTTYRVQYDNVYGSYYTPYIVGAKRIV